MFSARIVQIRPTAKFLDDGTVTRGHQIDYVIEDQEAQPSPRKFGPFTVTADDKPGWESTAKIQMAAQVRAIDDLVR